MRRQITEYMCDVCGCEIAEEIIIPKRIETDGKVGAIINLDPQDNADVCIYCFIKAVNSLDKRPKVVKP